VEVEALLRREGDIRVLIAYLAAQRVSVDARGANFLRHVPNLPSDASSAQEVIVVPIERSSGEAAPLPRPRAGV
jgi:hypothetical protein